MGIDAREKPAMDPQILHHRKAERIFSQQHRDAGRHLVGLLGTVLPLLFGFTIVAFDQTNGLGQRDSSFNVVLRRLAEVLRGLEPIHGLQADRRIPGIAQLSPAGLDVPDILRKRVFSNIAHEANL